MILTRAPLRIPLGGGGTDFTSYAEKYGGYILGFAIQKYVYVVLHETLDKKIRLKYSKVEEVDTTDELDNRVAAEALNFFGISSGIEIATFSDVPVASGLGGSSAFCVALVAALRTLQCKLIDRPTIYHEAYEIEREWANQPGGMQDQWFAAYGHSYAIDVGKNAQVNARYLDINKVLSNLTLVYTGRSRKSQNGLDIGLRQVLETKKDTPEMVKNLNKIKSLGQETKDYIESGDVVNLGRTFYNHWNTKKMRDPAVTTPEIDALYEEALSKGAIGGKVVGLGGGGYLLLCSENPLRGFSTVDLRKDVEGVKVLYSV